MTDKVKEALELLDSISHCAKQARAHLIVGNICASFEWMRELHEAEGRLDAMDM